MCCPSQDDIIPFIVEHPDIKPIVKGKAKMTRINGRKRRSLAIVKPPANFLLKISTPPEADKFENPYFFRLFVSQA
jgi:hypothetical protein